VSELAVEVRGLHKRYAQSLGGAPIDALRGVDLCAQAGSAFGLIGPNGAGKTTLLKILLGLVAKSEGHVRVLGAEPSDVRVRAQVGYLPERLHMPQAFGARTFLRSVARLKRVAQPEREVARQLERVDLAAHAGLRIGSFSKGMRQRLGLAAALLGEPALLVLDEPTDGIDPRGRVEVRAILGEERARGATIFLNSHLITETEQICDHICILVRGRVVRAGTMRALCGDPLRWRVRFAGAVDPSALTQIGLRATEEPDAYACDGDARALNLALDRARTLGLMIVELSPAVRSLEQVLLDTLDAHHA
jgi:ABC-2 type transport system ATP-binding protein